MNFFQRLFSLEPEACADFLMILIGAFAFYSYYRSKKKKAKKDKEKELDDIVNS
ncbi:MAG: hypothetical protein MI810_04095 [Flavobacteriales bacterium]|nr:hypothetical protein [Flavobacteriales bacterium]